MRFYRATYKTPQGTVTTVRVATGGVYTTINDFVREFAQDHPSYVLQRVEEA